MWLLLLTVAQATPDETYVRLRERLTTEFLVVGEDQGESLPATRRTEHQVKWADATIMHGWYLGILAVEHALLRDEALDVDLGITLAENAAELDLALAALDRVDAHPGGAFPGCDPSPGALDGFLVRDDVPLSVGEALGAPSTASDWTDASTHLKEMSQDQAVHLLMGLALVRRYVGDADAAAAAARIGEHIAAGGEWVVRNPLCDDREVARGAQAQFYSTGFSAAIEVASGQPAVEGMFPDLWDDFRDPDALLYENVDNRHMVLTLAAVGGEWTAEDIAAVAAVEDWDRFYPLLRAALHGGEGPDPTADLEALGEREPASTWPEDAGHPWTLWNRYFRPAASAGVGSEGSGGQRYNGLDWMLTWALDAAVNRADWPEEEAVEPPEACGCRTAGSPLWLGLLTLATLRRARRLPRQAAPR